MISRYCRDYRISVHNNALACLQRGLSLEIYSLSSNNTLKILEEVIFDLLSRLLQIQPSGKLTKDSLENIRLRAISIQCKTFLQFIPKLIVLDSFKTIWEKILDYIQKFMNADESELLAEAVPLTLKNMLVVMHTNGILIPPAEGQTGEEDNLWKISWDNIDKFYPKLKEEFSMVIAKSPGIIVETTNSINPSQ